MSQKDLRKLKRVIRKKIGFSNKKIVEEADVAKLNFFFQFSEISVELFAIFNIVFTSLNNFTIFFLA